RFRASLFESISASLWPNLDYPSLERPQTQLNFAPVGLHQFVARKIVNAALLQRSLNRNAFLLRPRIVVEKCRWQLGVHEVRFAQIPAQKPWVSLRLNHLVQPHHVCAAID